MSLVSLPSTRPDSQTSIAPARWVLVACGFFAAFTLFAIYAERCLYSDGSYFFVKVLQSQNFVETVGLRDYVAFLFQLPLVAALKMGVTSIPCLAIAYSLGCFAVWPVAMYLCYRMAPQHFWLVLLACAAGYLNAAFMAVGEHIGAHALFWPALFAILFVRPLTPFAAVVLLGSTIILIRSYESMLFLGPLMVALLVWRMVRDKECLWRQAVLFAAAVFLIASIYVSWEEIKYPNPYYTSFKQDAFNQISHPGWTLKMSCLWLALALGALYRPVAEFLQRRAGLALIGLVILVWDAWPLLAPGQFDPQSQYHCRFLELLVPLVLLPVAVILAEKPQWLAAQIPQWTKLAAILLIAQSLWQLSATWQWQGYLRDWNKFLTVKTGPVFLEQIYGYKTSDNGQALRFDWSWSNPDLGLAVGPRRVRAIVMPSTMRDVRFNPLNPRTLPDLSRYGVDYTDYIAALERQKLIRDH
jgi:hypothetical protein